MTHLSYISKQDNMYNNTTANGSRLAIYIYRDESFDVFIFTWTAAAAAAVIHTRRLFMNVLLWPFFF
jgi:hypothetical protein